jgi:hypothetical protein
MNAKLATAELIDVLYATTTSRLFDINGKIEVPPLLGAIDFVVIKLFK